MAKKIITICVAILLLMCFFAGGFVTGCIIKGKETDTERELAEKYLADNQRLTERIESITARIESIKKYYIGELERINSDLRHATEELGRIKRDLEQGFDGCEKRIDTLDAGLKELERRFQ